MAQLVIVSARGTDFGFLPQSLNVVRETRRSAVIEVVDESLDLASIRSIFDAHQCDAALFENRPRLADFKLVAMDMDATTIENETLDEMADIAGVGEKVKAITERAMRGELDFEASLRARVATLKGFPAALYETVIRDRLKVQPAIASWFDALDDIHCHRILISGGFQPVVDHFVKTLGFDAGFANRMRIDNDTFTGELEGELVDSLYKANRLKMTAESLGIDRSRTIAIGDGANDIPMLEAAGLAIGYRPKPALEVHADIVLRHTGYETLRLFFA